MRAALKILGGLFLLVVATFASLIFATRGSYQVRALVTEGASLPAQTIAGLKLHMRRVRGPADAQTVIVLHGGPGGDFRP